MIDWQRIGELRDTMGEAGFQEVAELLLLELAESCARLSAGVPPELLAAELNGVLTGALNLGLQELAELASEGRDLALAGLACRIDLIHLGLVFEDSRNAILAAIDGPPALRLVG